MNITKLCKPVLVLTQIDVKNPGIVLAKSKLSNSLGLVREIKHEVVCPITGLLNNNIVDCCPHFQLPMDDVEFFNLILVSVEADEKLEIGDTIWHKLDEELSIIDDRVLIYDDVERLKELGYKKVIATQNEISEKDIEEIIDDYNTNGYSFNQVSVEMEEIMGNEGLLKIVHGEYDYELKKINNKIVIKKDDWTDKWAIKYIPELPHVINSVSELRGFFKRGLEIGYKVAMMENEKYKIKTN